ncbi:MAG: hypothetical protein HC802_02295 [Caldilineaceae bacterium]|nr:hypothetical protein [Caldilineaceae bacterium]
MPDQYVELAKENMGALERLVKGLPGIQGYVDKNLRRDADKRLRTLIAGQLEEQKQRLFDIQQKLLKGGGLKWLDDVDGAIQKLQILIDRIKTASYGYAGLFDAVAIREEQLDALHRFDVALAGRVVMVENAVDALAAAVANKEDVGVIADQLTDIVAELNNMFNRREEAVLDTALLLDTSSVPEIDPTLLAESE